MLTLTQSEDFRPEESYVIWAFMDSKKKTLHLHFVWDVWLTLVDGMNEKNIFCEMIVLIY